MGGRGQFDIWQAVYSPAGKDGYPQPIFDKQTGAIDHKTAEYWREHYDLDAILQTGLGRWGRSCRGRFIYMWGS